ncbi:MAG: inorganic pyrophosphatase [Bacteroidetes bacterium]|nr:inorganic pyrophosphatase [Bacteroidota bacterium]
MARKKDSVWKMMGMLFRAHPWHGIPIGEQAPEVVGAYIEIVPTDTIKYELDKQTGYLKVDRPQLFSNICPTLYGLIPQTYCDELVGEYCSEKVGRPGILGDGDPLDICVLTEKTISHGDILMQCIPIGGMRMIDGDEADDKIIAVMKGDALYGKWNDIGDVPVGIIERLRHYFLTYKSIPGSTPRKKVEITHIYNKIEAYEVINRSHADYHREYGDIEEMLTKALKG